VRILLRWWLPALGGVGVATLIALIVQWPTISTAHKLSYAVAITLVLHVYEEERFPGGFAYMFNVIRAKSDVPDRYPMSPLIAMVVDVSVFLVLFVPALIVPGVWWLAMGPMFAAIMECLVHSGMGLFSWRRRGLSIYNPGLATAWVFAAIAITYIVVTHQVASGRDWAWATLYFVSTILVFLALPELGLRSKTTRWGFDHAHYLGYYRRYTTIEELFGDHPGPSPAT
jgi:hypothetical protein